MAPKRPALGFSVLEAVITAGIVAGITILSASSLRRVASDRKSVEVRSQVNAIGRAIFEGIDCDLTFGTAPIAGPGSCPLSPGGIYLNLISQANTVLVGSGGTRLGDYMVLARCSQDLGLDVRVARLKQGRPIPPTFAKADMVPDDYHFDPSKVVPANPGAGTRFDYTHPQARLFLQGAGPCQEIFSGTPTANATAMASKGTIIHFAGNCPQGWAPVMAGGGRYLVGLWPPPTGTPGGVVGKALANGENRPTATHTHALSKVATGAQFIITDNVDDRVAYSNIVKSPAVKTDGVRDLPAGTTAAPGTIAPYVQYVACRRI